MARKKSTDLAKMSDKAGKFTVLEAAEIAKALEEEWGVRAAAAVVVGDASSDRVPDKSIEEFDVILTGDGGNLIQVIKEVRAITGLSLSQAKSLVERAPNPLKKGVVKEEASKIKEVIESVGGSAILESVEPSDEVEIREFLGDLVGALHEKFLVEPNEHIERIRKILAPVMEN